MKKAMCVILMLAISSLVKAEEDFSCDKVAEAMVLIHQGKDYLNGDTPGDKENAFQLAVRLKTTFGDEVARQALYLYDVHVSGIDDFELTNEAATGICEEFYE